MTRIYILISAVIVLFSVVFATYKVNVTTVNKQSEAKLLSDLTNQINTISAISIVSQKQILLKAELQAGEWITTHQSEQFIFPANQKNVNTLLHALANAKIMAVKTSLPERYFALGTESIEKPQSNSTLVTIANADKQWQLLIGKVSEHQNTSFARIVGKSQSVLLDRLVTLPVEKTDWLQQPLIEVNAETIEAIDVSDTNVVNFDKEQAEKNAPELLNALLNMTYLNVLERKNVLLNWFTREPARSIRLLTIDNEYELLLFENTESGQVWLMVNSDNRNWQNDWTFELTEFTAKRLMMELE